MATLSAAGLELAPPHSPARSRHALGTPPAHRPSDRRTSATAGARRPWDRLSLEARNAGRAPQRCRPRFPHIPLQHSTIVRSRCPLTVAAAAAWAEPGRPGLGLRRPVLASRGSQRGFPPNLLHYQQQSHSPTQLPHTSHRSSHKSQVAGTHAAASQEESQEEGGLSGTEPRAPLLLVPMLALALVLCNADRVIMSVTVVPLAALNAWTPTTAGVVQSSFLWGYALTPILGGALADAWGGHPVLSAGIALWSAATLFTPLAALGRTWGAPGAAGVGEGAAYPGRPLWPLLLVRAVMGLGEGVALPCMNNLVARFVPKRLRATAVATCFVGFHLGCMVGLLAAPALMSLALPLPSLAPGPAPGAPSLATPFLFFGAVGFLWLGLWSLLRGALKLPQAAGTGAGVGVGVGVGAGVGAGAGGGVKEGAQEALAPAPKRRAVQMPPFRLLLSKAPVWALICANAVNNWGYFVLLSWMPLYFKQATGVDLRQAAWFSALPWAVMAAASVVAGRVADSLASKGMDTTRLRKLMQSIGFVGPGMALLCLTLTRSANVAVCLLAAALATSSFSQAGFLLNYQDIAPRYVGVLHGISNTAGTLAGIGSTVISGMLVERFGSFTAVLTLTSLLYCVGTVVWLTFATGEVVFE